MIAGVGVDLVEIARIDATLARFGARFEQRCFAAVELEQAPAGPHRAAFYAGRFAMKEAVMKALGTGRSRGVLWRNVATRSLPSGQPVVELSGGAAKRAAELGIVRWSVALTDQAGQSLAMAVAESADLIVAEGVAAGRRGDEKAD
ncbi:MAG TPA: holo-ACP synthase [Limnochordia bacterium]|nr:holo-ACP synthase [Limnochordia bacterium]